MIERASAESFYPRAAREFETPIAQLSLRLEFVADLPDGEDVPRLSRVGLELPS